MCPKGDDPFTFSKDYRTVEVATAAASGSLNGLMKFSFGDSYFYFSADASLWDSQDCEADVEAMSNVDVASCSRSTVNADNGATYTIQFREFPLFPVDNNIYFNDGDPPNSYFKCETYKVTGGTSPSCTVTDVAVTSLPGRQRWCGRRVRLYH